MVPTAAVLPAHGVGVGNLPHFVVVSGSSQSGQTLGVQHANAGVELVPVIAVQGCPKGVDGDDESSAICFKLPHRQGVTWTQALPTIL